MMGDKDHLGRTGASSLRSQFVGARVELGLDEAPQLGLLAVRRSLERKVHLGRPVFGFLRVLRLEELFLELGSHDEVEVGQDDRHEAELDDELPAELAPRERLGRRQALHDLGLEVLEGGVALPLLLRLALGGGQLARRGLFCLAHVVRMWSRNRRLFEDGGAALEHRIDRDADGGAVAGGLEARDFVQCGLQELAELERVLVEQRERLGARQPLLVGPVLDRRLQRGPPEVRLEVGVGGELREDRLHVAHLGVERLAVSRRQSLR
mmetsp:Transcript_26255/g.105042  ORF Transcript_26255/g.105042 Transcript_26255/m.105042 type:complete len:266 (+) Transcript_26255:981-1778(+)